MHVQQYVYKRKPCLQSFPRTGPENLLQAVRFPWHVAFTAVSVFFLFLLPNQCVCAVTMCLYTHICVEIVYELPLLPSNTACETFLQELEQYEVLTVIIGTLPWQ